MLIARRSLEAIGAIENALDPCGVIEMPADSLAEAALKILLRSPAELSLGAPGVDGITKIVTGAVGDVSDSSVVWFTISARAGFVEE